jgi:hypothetical protein
LAPFALGLIVDVISAFVVLSSLTGHDDFTSWDNSSNASFVCAAALEGSRSVVVCAFNVRVLHGEIKCIAILSGQHIKTSTLSGDDGSILNKGLGSEETSWVLIVVEEGLVFADA